MKGLASVLRRLGGRAAAAPALSPRGVCAATIDFAAPAVAQNPFPYWDALRRRGAVHHLPRHDAWIVVGFDAAKAAFAQPQLFSNAPYADLDEVLLGRDPPVHLAVRRILSRHFTAERLGDLERVAAGIAAERLRPRMDAVEEYAVPVSRGVAASLIGFDETTVAEIVAAKSAATAAARPFAELLDTLDRVAPRAALHGALLEGGDPLIGEREARSLVRLLWLAAATTSERVIARCVLNLLADKELQARVRADRALLGPLIEEVVRLHPEQHFVRRRTTEAVELAGTAIPAGALVHLCIAAANRDPEQFEAPSELRLDRAPRRHFAFGTGVHQCIGAPLARRTVAAALGTLLDAAPDLRPLQPLAAVPFFSSITALTPSRLEIGL